VVGELGATSVILIGGVNSAARRGIAFGLAGLAIIAGFSTGLAISLFSGGGARPQEIASGLMGAVAEHLARIFGTSVAGRNPDPKKPKKPTAETIEVWKNQIKGYLNQIVKRVGNDWSAIQRY
jgi:hypothetical protein